MENVREGQEGEEEAQERKRGKRKEEEEEPSTLQGQPLLATPGREGGRGTARGWGGRLPGVEEGGRAEDKARN